jgi:hypothetical protein
MLTAQTKNIRFKSTMTYITGVVDYAYRRAAKAVGGVGKTYGVATADENVHVLMGPNT